MPRFPFHKTLRLRHLALGLRVRWHLLRGHPEAALCLAEAHATRDPKNYLAYRWRCTVLFLLGRPEEALRCLRICHRLAPDRLKRDLPDEYLSLIALIRLEVAAEKQVVPGQRSVREQRRLDALPPLSTAEIATIDWAQLSKRLAEEAPFSSSQEGD